jgi:hypothetical protein
MFTPVAFNKTMFAPACKNCRYYRPLDKSCRVFLKPVEKAVTRCEMRLFVPTNVTFENKYVYKPKDDDLDRTSE